MITFLEYEKDVQEMRKTISCLSQFSKQTILEAEEELRKLAESYGIHGTIAILNLCADILETVRRK